jgi:hypothetical protein
MMEILAPILGIFGGLGAFALFYFIFSLIGKLAEMD